MRESIFITGMYRSGTTYLHRLLDGHSQLNVFPVENCICRDLLVYEKLPNPHLRQLITLEHFIKNKCIDDAVNYIFSHEKLGLPLHSEIKLSGATGRQNVKNLVNVENIRFFLESELAKYQYNKKSFARDISKIYSDAFFLNHETSKSRYLLIKPQIIIHKCPEAGYLIDYYLQNFDNSKIIHVIRDPRNVISSFKAGMPTWTLHYFTHIYKQLKLINNSMNYNNQSRILILRYEDLINNTPVFMKKISTYLKINYNKNLCHPNILGDDWISNSSFQITNQKTNINNFERNLNFLEILLIEAFCKKNMIKHYYKISSNIQFNKYALIVFYFIISIFHVPTYLFKLTNKLKKVL